MPRLNFKKQFCKAVLGGQKTTTLRDGNASPCKRGTGSESERHRLAPNQFLRSGQTVQTEPPKTARADGFASLNELFAGYQTHHPNQKGDGKKCIGWRLAGETSWQSTDEKQPNYGQKTRPQMGGDEVRAWPGRFRTSLTRRCGASQSLAPLSAQSSFFSMRPMRVRGELFPSFAITAFRPSFGDSTRVTRFHRIWKSSVCWLSWVGQWGSATSIIQNFPIWPERLSCLSDMIAADRPVLGICLGA